jgi:hypothetical protein
MNTLGIFNFASPLVDLTRQAVASDAMQRWMLAVYDFVGTPYKDFPNPACSAPGFNLASYTYRLTGGDCQVNILFDFTGGLGTDYALSLPVPALANFGLLTCYMNSVGQPVISAVALILSDGLLHFAMSGAATFPTGTVTCSISGRYSL